MVDWKESAGGDPPGCPELNECTENVACRRGHCRRSHGVANPRVKEDERLAVQAFTTERELVRTSKMPPEGLEQVEKPSGNTHFHERGVTKSVTIDFEAGLMVTDPGLSAVIAAWPDLPPALRAAIVALVSAVRE
jgi:hypothetical protein